MRRVLYIYLLAYAALSMSAVARVAHADSEASVETHISGSSQMTVQVGNTVETSSSSGGTVDVHIETTENGTKRTSVFHKDLAPGETFHYATTTAVDTARSGAAVSVHAAAFVTATSSTGTASATRARSLPAVAAASVGADTGTVASASAPVRTTSRLLMFIGNIRFLFHNLFSWW